MCYYLNIGKPKISVTPSNITVSEGCIALFTCLNNGEPPTNFTWYFNGRILSNTFHTVIRSNGDLIIHDTNSSDAGTYTCQFINSTSLISDNITVESTGVLRVEIRNRTSK